MRLHLGRSTQVGSLAGLVKQMPDKEFVSLTRSTVLLLAWWDDEARVQSLGDILGLGDLGDGDARFEYSVAPGYTCCGGRGRASSTDVLLELGGNVVAVEAKHRETLYETVAEWLGSSASNNKKWVLHHWLRCCIRTSASLEQCMGLVYQMVHRTASACHVAAQRSASAHVVHLLLGSEHADAYVEAVNDLADVLADAKNIRFAVVVVPTTKASAFDEVELEHQRRGPDALRKALADGKRLFEFGRPEVIFRRP
jgi:hypothetical protein